MRGSVKPAMPYSNDLFCTCSNNTLVALYRIFSMYGRSSGSDSSLSRSSDGSLDNDKSACIDPLSKLMHKIQKKYYQSERKASKARQRRERKKKTKPTRGKKFKPQSKKRTIAGRVQNKKVIDNKKIMLMEVPEIDMDAAAKVKMERNYSENKQHKQTGKQFTNEKRNKRNNVKLSKTPRTPKSGKPMK